LNADPRETNPSERRFVILLAAGAGIAAALPAIWGYFHTPPGGQYLGYQYNTDDHMVYAAWMRQAMDGHLLMDNRFTTDAQPGLTIHLYFFVLGLLAKLLGIGLVANAARIGFSVGFVFLLHRFVSRLDANLFARKLAMALAVFGGGLGFLVWHSFGLEIVRPAPPVLSGLMLGRLPTDVWQPEGFVFSSMLTNGLFMVSLCLIVTIFLSVLTSQRGWGRVAIGAGASLVLMNIHSYDVLLVGIVLLGLLAMQLFRRAMTVGWFARAAAVMAGAVLPSVWFIYVLSQDPVFRSRAETETYSPNFRQVLFGYLPLMILGFVALLARSSATSAERKRRIAGAILAALVFVVFTVAAKYAGSDYFLSPSTWCLAFAAMTVALMLLADENPAWNIVASWALLGIVALYFPGLFQRKLAMGLAIPWAILAALAIAYWAKNQENSTRNLATALIVLVCSASSFRWLVREFDFIRWNVSSTAEQPVYLSSDAVRIVAALNALPGKKVVVAPPGVHSVQIDPGTGGPLVDSFGTPIVPDLNSIVSGLTGSYTYAGHWSETPQYNERRGEMSRLFYNRAELPQERLDELHRIGAQYVIAPVPEAFPELFPFDFKDAGKVVVDGTQFRLVKVGG
jgi:hypothetical protein